MCGRFALTTSFDDLKAEFEFKNHLVLKPRYNIAPSQWVPVITQNHQFTFMKWGFIPAWAGKRLLQAPLINARLETAAEKPSFKRAFVHRRCGIVCSGYFEWRTLKTQKHPYYVFRQNHQPFVFAGIWEAHITLDNQQIETCAILTTPAESTLSTLHERTPVMLSFSDFAPWLDSGALPKENALLKKMGFYPVSKRINDPKYDAPGCLERLS